MTETMTTTRGLAADSVPLSVVNPRPIDPMEEMRMHRPDRDNADYHLRCASRALSEREYDAFNRHVQMADAIMHFLDGEERS